MSLFFPNDQRPIREFGWIQNASFLLKDYKTRNVDCQYEQTTRIFFIDALLSFRYNHFVPRFNFYIILFATLVYFLTAGVTLRDRLLISTLHRIERESIVEPSTKALFEGAMSGMAAVLSDEYSRYIPPSRETIYRDRLDNRYDGFGIAVRLHVEEEENQFFIDYPQHDSPAYRAGLRSGDRILQINGTSLADKTYSETFRLLRQPTESKTRLSVLPFGQTESKDVFIQRAKIHSDSVAGDYFDSDGRVFCLEAHPQIGYIRIALFSGTTAKEFGDALDRMEQRGVESFILDLRDNAGGDVWSCILIARKLMSPDSVSGNVVVAVRDREGTERLRHRHLVLIEGTQRSTLPMAVLINGESASASEILAAALQDHHRATIVGTRSFGKGIIQSIIDLPFRSGILQLTDSEYRRPNGAPIHRRGNAPDSDEWGVIPDKIVELSETKQSTVMAYRTLRSNAISPERLAVLEQFRQQIERQDDDFKFTGTAPYYDPQLDEAIKILLEPTQKKE